MKRQSQYGEDKRYTKRKEMGEGSHWNYSQDIGSHLIMTQRKDGLALPLVRFN